MKRLRVNQGPNKQFNPLTENGQLKPYKDPERFSYFVTKVTNSTTPVLGQLLTSIELDVYCADDTWDVVISND